jgi:hypothetical protein
MAAPKMYGVLLGVLLAALSILKNPIAWAVFWMVQTILLATYTRLTWKRTGLLWMTIGGAHATLIALLLGLASLAGYTISAVPPLLIALNLIALSVFYILARTLHRDHFRQWRRHMDGMTLVDMMRFRHIPYLK